MKRFISFFSLAALCALPATALAALPGFQPLPEGANFSVGGVLATILTNVVWPIAAFTVVVMFIYAGIMFLTARGDPGKLGLARSAFLWGVIGVIVIFLAYSIIAIVTAFFGSNNTGGQQTVCLPQGNSCSQSSECCSNSCAASIGGNVCD